MKPVINSVVLAAGASTRMRSRKSKLLQPLLGRTLISWALEQAEAMEPQKIVFVLGHQREMIEPELKAHKARASLEFAHQKETKGTADAVKVALEKLEDQDPASSHVFIMGGDAVLLTKESMALVRKTHLDSKAILTVMTAKVPDPGELGRIVRGADGHIEKIVEFKDASEEEKLIREVNSGFYLIQLSDLKETLSSVKDKNSSSEFYLTDLVELIRKKGGLVKTQVLLSPEEALGVNTHSELVVARKVLQSRINRKWMQEGVCFEDPETIWVDHDVLLESDVHLEPGVCLRGKTKIGFGTRIGAYSVIHDSHVDRLSMVQAYSHLMEAEVGEACSVGPYARLRPGARLHRNVKVGNFVEVKKSELLEGSKASHLSYLGDATIGEGSNVGAGTITCNYDGFNKSKTVLGKNVFIGSNCSLVAPLELGDGSIVGAGSVVTNSVAKDSLVMERSEQLELKDAAKKYRAKRSKDS